MALLDVTFQEVLPNCSTNPSRGVCFFRMIFFDHLGDGRVLGFWDNCCKTSTKRTTYYVEVGGVEVRFAGRFANLNTWHFDVSMLLCSQF